MLNNNENNNNCNESIIISCKCFTNSMDGGGVRMAREKDTRTHTRIQVNHV